MVELVVEFVASSESKTTNLKPPTHPQKMIKTKVKSPLSLLVPCCKVRVQYWSLLLTFWFADLAVGLSTGMQAQMYYPTGLGCGPRRTKTTVTWMMCEGHP